VIGLRKGSGRGPVLVVSAHLDTVFPEGTEVKVKVKDHKYHAPGIYDDGRGLASLLTVIRALNQANIRTVGDIVFTALYAVASRRHHLSMARTALALGLGYVAVMLLVLALELAIPALPLLGVAIAVAHPQARRPAAADRARGFTLSALVVAAVVVLLLRR